MIDFPAALPGAKPLSRKAHRVSDACNRCVGYGSTGDLDRNQRLESDHRAGGTADAGWTVIAPSRFGYLRSAFPADPSSENQADAFIDLMDELGIARAPVIGGSAGALSAMQFAIRHPERCSALVTIVPAAFAPGHPPARPPNALARAIIEHGLRSDFLFWLGLVTAEDAIIGALLATDPGLVHAASLAEQARVRSILRDIQPVSLRAEGLLNDGALAGNPKPMDIKRIIAPTFVASLEDDRFETAAAARHIASSVPGAELVIYPSGGHVWVGHNDDLFARIDAFLRETFSTNAMRTGSKPSLTLPCA